MLCDRREFLAAALTVPAVAGVSRRRAVLDRGFARVERLADGVYVTLADPAKGPQCLSNGGVIVGRDATLVVEGHFRAEGAAFEVEVARGLSRRPIRAAVDTHFHLDHTFGNIGYEREGIPIIAHERVPALMQRQYGDAQGPITATRANPLDALRIAQ